MDEGYAHKHLYWFVIGALRECLKASGQPVEGPTFDMHLRETMHHVVLYMRGALGSRAPLTDCQRYIAVEAAGVFARGSVRARKSPTAAPGAPPVTNTNILLQGYQPEPKSKGFEPPPRKP